VEDIGSLEAVLGPCASVFEGLVGTVSGEWTLLINSPVIMLKSFQQLILDDVKNMFRIALHGVHSDCTVMIGQFYAYSY
jgi:hypothetical protein